MDRRSAMRRIFPKCYVIVNSFNHVLKPMTADFDENAQCLFMTLKNNKWIFSHLTKASHRSTV